MKKYKVYIGIDCGVSTGIAIWNKDIQVLTVASVMIHNAMYQVKYAKSVWGDNLFVRVEDARKRKWIPKMPNSSRERGRREGAGSIKRDAKIWEDFLTDIGVDFEMVAPKNNKTKLTAELFKKITWYQGETNSHSRDAGMLVYGL